MVRFVTTAYTHMYENSYTGRSNLDHGPSRSRLGSRVEKLRKECRLTAGDMARFLQISPERYQDFLNGRYRISQEELRELADLFGVKTAELFDSPGAQESVSAQKLVMMIVRPPKRGDRVPKKPHTDGGKAVKVTTNVVVSPKIAPNKAYDPNEAAALLAKRFGTDKVARIKG